MNSYFCTEKDRTGTCYHEFIKGTYKGEHWVEDSLLLHDDIMQELKLKSLLKKVIPDYDPYGITVINALQWNQLCQYANEASEALQEAVSQLDQWVREAFETESVISILGI